MSDLGVLRAGLMQNWLRARDGVIRQVESLTDDQLAWSPGAGARRGIEIARHVAVARDPAGRQRHHILGRLELLLAVLAAVGPCQREHLVQHHAQAVDVGAMINLRGIESLLRRHEIDRSHDAIQR